jgi:uncharacterized protein YjbI with pentapeptide repeats
MLVAWNQWRQECPDVQPDLSGIDLSNVILYNPRAQRDFVGINFNRTNLQGVNFAGADIRGADLT